MCDTYGHVMLIEHQDVAVESCSGRYHIGGLAWVGVSTELSQQVFFRPFFWMWFLFSLALSACQVECSRGTV